MQQVNLTIIASTLALAQSSHVKVYTTSATFYFVNTENWAFFFLVKFLDSSLPELAQWFPPLAGNRVRSAGMSAVNVGGLRMVADGVNEFTVCWSAGWNEDGAVGAQTPHELENVYLL